jgi:hypothetical protein
VLDAQKVPRPRLVPSSLESLDLQSWYAVLVWFFVWLVFFGVLVIIVIILCFCFGNNPSKLAGGLFIMGAVQPPAPGGPPSPSVLHHSNNMLIGSISVGSMSGNFKNESTFIDAISETNPEKPLHIFDTGHQNTPLLPNYPRVRFYFLGLAGVPYPPFSLFIVSFELHYSSLYHRFT